MTDDRDAIAKARDEAHWLHGQVPTSANPTSDYTLTIWDVGHRVRVNAASAAVVTVPANVCVEGDVIEVAQRGAGQLTITAGNGLTLHAPNGPKTRVQYSAVRVIFDSTTEATVDGDTSS